MKTPYPKTIKLLGALTLAAAGASQAASIYVPANNTAPWTNFHAPGNYRWGGNAFTQNIGVVTGNAFVEASWGVNSMHSTTAQYSFNGAAPVAINQTRAWNQTSTLSGGWSGFGGPGAGVYNLTGSSTLTGTAISAISETRVTAITGTIVKVADQAGINTGWAGTVNVATPGVDGYRYGNTNQYYYYAPGLTGKYDLDVSWGVGATGGVSASWFLDLNNTGNPVDYVPILTAVNTQLFSDGGNRSGFTGGSGTTWGQWSGFADAGLVTLNSNSRIVYQNLNGGSFGTVSDLQLTPVPEPAAIGMLGLGALLFVNRRRRL